jgi:hypothetical protein
LYWNSNDVWLAGAECDDAANWVVGGNPDGYAITRHHFDAEAAHSAAQLGQYLMAGVALHAVEPAAVNGHDCALHVYEVILAQTASNPFLSNNYYARQTS